MTKRKKTLIINKLKLSPQQSLLKNVPVLSHNIGDKTTQILQVKQNFELVCLGNQYDSMAAIFSVCSLLFKPVYPGKLALLNAAKDLGIDILTAVQETDICLRDETVYFDILIFESWLEVNGNNLKSSSFWKYVPYLAVRRKKRCWESRETPLIKLE